LTRIAQQILSQQCSAVLLAVVSSFIVWLTEGIESAYMHHQKLSVAPVIYQEAIQLLTLLCLLFFHIVCWREE
jgi:uncharacterized protein with PQ loop repeat